MRSKSVFAALVATAFFCTTSAVFAGAVTSKEEISIKTTGGGIKIKSNNGNSFAIGGRIMYDYDSYDGLYNAGNAGDDASESEFRRTRINVKGTSGKNWGYKMTIDIDEGETEINTGYIKYKGLDFADVMIGRFNAPFGLEALTSSKWISTIERSPATELGFLAGKPSFQVALHGHSDRMFWQAALIDEDMEDDDGSDAYSMAGRVGGHFGSSKTNFVHMAASYAVRDFGDAGTARFRTRLGTHTVERVVVDGGTRFAVDDADQLGVEAAGVFGPLSLQAEYRTADFDEDSGEDNASDADVRSYYIQASYILTGESRGYKGKAGEFDKVSPKGTMGAWELVAKYEDGEVDVDILDDEAEWELMTLGLNWYATKNVKFMLNYLDGDTDYFYGSEGSLDELGEEDGKAISFRTQYAF